MVQIIRLHGDPHEQTQTLLAWYVNGSLDADEVEAVEAHLVECAECRADLKLEHKLGETIASLSTEMESGWAALRERVESQPKAQRRPLGRVRATAFLRRPIAIGWALAAQAASLVLIVGLGWFSVAQSTHPLYQALGAAPMPSNGNVVVVFKPTTSEKELRGVLVNSGARLVDGPTVSDAYVLHVAGVQRNDALAKLRASGRVVVAEPIDGDARP
jgi:predicted anti-sigma-YlaC factor YlaD